MPFPEFDPVLIHIGPLPLRWYALAYVAGILLGWWYAARLLRAERVWAPAR
ncbi:MAG: prolipoprotein diacylglyceryl transferase family protein, partial [Brevundimonas sp.]